MISHHNLSYSLLPGLFPSIHLLMYTPLPFHRASYWPLRPMATSSSGRWLTGDEQVFALNFLAPPSSNRDSWVVMEQQWLVRIHARLRKDYYHPVHDNNPVLTEQLSGRRVTVIFEMDGHQWTWRTVQPDEWGVRPATHSHQAMEHAVQECVGY